MKKYVLFTVVLFAGLGLCNAQTGKGDANWFKAQSKEAKIVSASATSELVEAQFEGRYLYSPANMLDGDMSTTWCEAEKNGSGLGQVITLEFAEPFSFDEIQIVNGFNYKNLYEQNNRVKKIQLTQVAKKHFQQKDYELADHTPDWQSIKFKYLQTAQTITIKILEVYRGTNFDDTCFSDIRFLCKGKVIPFKGVDELKAIQNENSRMLLNKDAARFEKDFLALFTKTRAGAASKSDLILLADNGKDIYHFVKDGNTLTFMMKRRIYKISEISKARSEIGPVYIANNREQRLVPLEENLELAGNAKYFVFEEPYWWYDEPDGYYSLKDYKIITHNVIDYVETETTTIVKLDGKNVYLNGVHYTIVDPEDFVIVSTPE